MARDRTLTVQHTVYLAPEMWNYLGQLARQRGRDCNENTLIREALRLYIENQVEVLGSRRHFQRSFQERIDQLEARLTEQAKHQAQTTHFHLHLLTQLVAFALAHLISGLTRREITAEQLIQKAILEARRDENSLAAQIQSGLETGKSSEL